MTDLREQIEAICERVERGELAAINATDAIMALIGWRDIESAPRDGTPVLVFSPYKDINEPTNVIVARFNSFGDEEWWEPCENLLRDVSGAIEPAPTHWMPLPQTPENTHDLH
jgi:hypothetical protein